MYRRFGSRVTVVERGDPLISRDDEDVSVVVREILEAEGVEFRLEATCITARNLGAQISIGVDCQRGETHSFMKILIDAETERILGAAILGVGGDEVIHSSLDIQHTDAPYTVIQRAIHIHPTVTVLIPTMLGDLRPLE